MVAVRVIKLPPNHSALRICDLAAVLPTMSKCMRDFKGISAKCVHVMPWLTLISIEYMIYAAPAALRADL